MKRALFLDRDGIINEDRHYVHRIEDFHFVDGIFDLCRAATDAGLSIIIVTNQAGIARGFYTEQQFRTLTAWMTAQFSDTGLKIDQVYFCPHHPLHGMGPYKLECHCRKPRPGMIQQAQAEHNICLRDSILIGDKESDILAAKAAGVGSTVLVSTGISVSEAKPTFHAENLKKALACLLRSGLFAPRH